LKKVLLLVLDGWGYSEQKEGNAIYKAHTPNVDSYYRDYPWSLLSASGEAVGLPPGQMGNSEVGHLNLGAGRIVYQELTRIGKCIESGEFFSNTVLLSAMEKTKKRKSSLHLIGLVSDGGVHSHFEHLLALLDMARRQEVENVYIHAILDGRDTIPFGARPFLEKLESLAAERQNGYVASISGRYYAMDRDRRWERVKKAYRVYTTGEGLRASSAVEALDSAYDRGEGDEFVQPTVIVDESGNPRSLIKTEDSVIFFNFRPDRARQITRAFIEEDFNGFERGDQPVRPYYVTMTDYDRDFKLPAAFTLDDLEATLGEVYAKKGKSQMRIAETEKYAHVTFFFNGGREKPFTGEERIMVPSPKVATYDLQPEMSAPEVAEKIVETIRGDRHHLIVSNFANADMVGHSGVLPAAVKAVETVDRELGKIIKEALARDWAVMICADHGNAEQMLSVEGETVTAHSDNPVPFILLGAGDVHLRERGILADVAPTILDLAGIPLPPEMSGKSMLLSD
jgi:2,3-bisphosphoglycerate-independent phosphoglycerate mutase